MTREEAIDFLNEKRDEYQKWLDITPEPMRTYPEICTFSEAIDLAISALRAQAEAEKGEPLTVEELRKMDGDKVYIHYIGPCDGFYEDETAPYYGKYEQYVQEYNGMLRACDLPLKYYRVTWLAYRRKPEEEAENA